jgi:hypothetical protein
MRGLRGAAGSCGLGQVERIIQEHKPTCNFTGVASENSLELAQIFKNKLHASNVRNFTFSRSPMWSLIL